MRDVGTLVWVVLVVIGVISSIASSVRKASRALPASGTPAPPRIPPQAWGTPGVVAPPPVAPPAAPTPRARSDVPRPAPPPQRAPDHVAHLPERRRIFAGKNELVRAVIAAEVLGKPRGLRDEHLSG